MHTHALHLVTTGRQPLSEVEAVLRDCRSDWIDVLHIREKARTAREHIEWYEHLKLLLPYTSIHINDRLDAAAAVGAPGVQLAFHSVPPEAARRILPQGTQIGCSIHSVSEAREAARHGADLLLFGHIYETASKAGLAGRGIAQLAEVVRSQPLPVIAIGGIEPHKVAEVMASGCSGIAVMSSVFMHEHPGEQVARFRSALDMQRIAKPNSGDDPHE